MFSKFFEVELDPCPSSVAEVYGTPEGGIVSFEDVQSADCGNGDGDDMWFSLEDSCYSKSSYLDAAESWEDADVRCVFCLGSHALSVGGHVCVCVCVYVPTCVCARRGASLH